MKQMLSLSLKRISVLFANIYYVLTIKIQKKEHKVQILYISYRLQQAKTTTAKEKHKF